MYVLDKTINKYFELPGFRVAQFVQREKYVARIDEHFSTPSRDPITTVLLGPGGIGKTQIAIEYARCRSALYEESFG